MVRLKYLINIFILGFIWQLFCLLFVFLIYSKHYFCLSKFTFLKWNGTEMIEEVVIHFYQFLYTTFFTHFSQCERAFIVHRVQAAPCSPASHIITWSHGCSAERRPTLSIIRPLGGREEITRNCKLQSGPGCFLVGHESLRRGGDRLICNVSRQMLCCSAACLPLDLASRRHD